MLHLKLAYMENMMREARRPLFSSSSYAAFSAASKDSAGKESFILEYYFLGEFKGIALSFDMLFSIIQ